MRDNDFADAPARRRRFDDDEPLFLKRGRREQPDPLPPADDPDGPPTGDRWSTWDQSTAGQRGPQPYPDWLVTDLAAVDTELAS